MRKNTEGFWVKNAESEDHQLSVSLLPDIKTVVRVLDKAYDEWAGDTHPSN